MKPAWDALMSKYAGSKSSGVYDVDCTEGGKELCEEVGVQGYPTIKYGDPSDKKALKSYEGGRDEESLVKFAEENLAPLCGPASMDACSDDEKALIEKFAKRTAADLNAEVKKMEKDFGARQKKLDKKTSKLSEKSNDHSEDEEEYRKSKPKKGKEKDHEAKGKKLEDKRKKLDDDQAAVDKEQETLKEDMKNSGIKLMKLVAKANKDKTDL